ncbi:hypothetical protein SVIO_111240 [Streptomyces violaceusniger]|uniref:Uncharacterized protein n=1 Tax=Streptomyces violaceusniger TaxID=68280 RepID=A0A4D4LFT0_STRVO|nr:hypothetical protein SVIO_111240 [Streptomyces violaceusniger]
MAHWWFGEVTAPSRNHERWHGGDLRPFDDLDADPLEHDIVAQGTAHHQIKLLDQAVSPNLVQARLEPVPVLDHGLLVAIGHLINLPLYVSHGKLAGQRVERRTT